ncbi:MAG TPA: hypothetical protein VJR30_21680, partial [Bradyrhizobium sp.]|nr:hypothetical protein [Bradyrhizobium sp.]
SASVGPEAVCGASAKSIQPGIYRIPVRNAVSQMQHSATKLALNKLMIWLEFPLAGAGQDVAAGDLGPSWQLPAN